MTEELSDIEIARAAQGDAKAFKRVYDHYSPFVRRVLYRTVAGDQEALDTIMQNTFVKIHGSLKGFRHKAAFSTWAYRVAYNEAMHYYKRKSLFNKRHVEFSDDTVGRGDASYEDKDTVNRILGSLSPEERFLLMSREVDGMSFEDIAVVTQKSPGALRTALHRIKADCARRFTK